MKNIVTKSEIEKPEYVKTVEVHTNFLNLNTKEALLNEEIDSINHQLKIKRSALTHVHKEQKKHKIITENRKKFCIECGYVKSELI